MEQGVEKEADECVEMDEKDRKEAVPAQPRNDDNEVNDDEIVDEFECHEWWCPVISSALYGHQFCTCADQGAVAETVILKKRKELCTVAGATVAGANMVVTQDVAGGQHS